MLDHRMETFLTVCETMNFTKAAAKLHITQPAVSQHIRYLEAAYDIPLFHYKERKLMLTPEGALLYKAGLAMRNDDRELRQRLHHARATSQPIHFGVTKTIGEYVVAPPLSRFLRRHPDAAMTMKIANTEELIRGLEEGDIQFALVEGYFDSEEFEALRYDTVAFVPVTSARHEFPKVPEKLEDLLTERLILREPGSGTRRLLETNSPSWGGKSATFRGALKLAACTPYCSFSKKIWVCLFCTNRPLKALSVKVGSCASTLWTFPSPMTSPSFGKKAAFLARLIGDGAGR